MHSFVSRPRAARRLASVARRSRAVVTRGQRQARSREELKRAISTNNGPVLDAQAEIVNEREDLQQRAVDMGSLYDPKNEKDACGVGFVANIKCKPSHLLVRDALEMLERMEHRGACGCDPDSGDGAGILVGIPHNFMKASLAEKGIALPEAGKYGMGTVFLSKNPEKRKKAKAMVEAAIKQGGHTCLGWRTVPTNSRVLGETSGTSEPYIEQVFIANSKQGLSQDDFERELYKVRRWAHRTHGAKTSSKTHRLYLCGLSTRVVTYKGQLSSTQVARYFRDLSEPEFESHVALVHSRFSTNTFPSWERAQPFRMLAHNGEINTRRGNVNWMQSRQGIMSAPKIGTQEELESLYPIMNEDTSDSGQLDNLLELLTLAGRPITEAMMMMIPEAWQNDVAITPEKKAFYEYNSCLMEPWDGPALMAFTDGKCIGATLDRNGLRPGRYYITKDDRVILGSEVGVLDLSPKDVIAKGRLQPGKMFLIDFEKQSIIEDEKIKHDMATRFPYGEWLRENKITLGTKASIPNQSRHSRAPIYDLMQRLRCFGYTRETLSMLVGPMAIQGAEALGSMGNDAALACLSTTPRLVFDYFHQLFAQVTNPPIDPIRESIVMTLACPVGPERNLLDRSPEHANRVFLEQPLLTTEEFFNFTHLKQDGWKSTELDSTFAVTEGPTGLEASIDRMCAKAEAAVNAGSRVLVISDRRTGTEHIPVPSLMACGAIHQHLVRKMLRSKCAIAVECGDAREVHHFCLLTGFGADAICPYMAYETVQHLIKKQTKKAVTLDQAIESYRKSVNAGMLKVFAKMGISTLASYKGAQIFEALGVGRNVIEKCFTGCASRIGGVGFEDIANDMMKMHAGAFPRNSSSEVKSLANPGFYHWRAGNDAEVHMNHPDAMASMQHAVRGNSREAYQKYADMSNNLAKQCTLRGQLELKTDFDYEDELVDREEIPLDLVEPASEIVKRFATGAMSYGSISLESHSTLAEAMNFLKGKSNTGEGGEDIERFGTNRNSAIKQVASGRFGVNINYLTNSNEIQIKMAQGAKPGEGGELPGYKVDAEIARVRHSTEGVGLISPPPHHDIYSIEDLAQLIYDLKNSNPDARISVKLVSEVGVGVIAAGVTKGKADHILISGYDGGTGASKWTGIKSAGLPWELGLAETHQTLVLNGLRDRVVVQTDGQLKTGLDVVKGAMLGAEEFCFATAPLIAMGCIMMRKCHLNTCPVGIATQDPHLRSMFAGTPEHVINYFFMVAEEARQIMARLGVRKINDLIGRVDLLKQSEFSLHKGLDLRPLLVPAHHLNPQAGTICTQKQDHALEDVLDRDLISACQPALRDLKPWRQFFKIKNTDRSVGAMLSHEVSKLYGENGLPEDTININLLGHAGQSFGAFLAHGVTLNLEGDSNDYVGKGLSGGIISVRPPRDSPFKSHENIIVGNVCLYGAIKGYAYLSGIAAERFCVRNSGAHAVIEGVGDHGCEYMTGGSCIILGDIGRNFAAGMSGGVAYIYDAKKLPQKMNMEMVGLEEIEEKEDMDHLKSQLEAHVKYTGSGIAKKILSNFNVEVKKFTKVMPHEYKVVLARKKAEAQKKLDAPARQIEAGPKKASSVARAPVPGRTPPSRPFSTGRRYFSTKPEAATPAPKTKPAEKAASAAAEKTRPVSVSNPDKVKGFMLYERSSIPWRDPKERSKDWLEVYTQPDPQKLNTQASRCMECGVPFCHTQNSGCPLGNKIPEWNDLVFQNNWEEAYYRLIETNNFPEFTGRVCPAPCEGACVLGITEDPVTIKNIENTIIDTAFEKGWVKPNRPASRTGKRIAVVGSGPAGLAAADQLNKAGHTVTVFERADRVGGLLMYGIPNMKLDKTKVVERRIKLMEESGIEFVSGTSVVSEEEAAKVQGDAKLSKTVIGAETIASVHDAVILAAGATIPRDLNVPGRNLKNIHFAMDFLTPNTKSYLDSNLKNGEYISAKGKHVVVIGGGDTGTDCIGTSVRHGALSVTNLELLPLPPDQRAEDNPWPQWPRIYRVDYGHEEAMAAYGGEPRTYSKLTKEFIGDKEGKVTGVKVVDVHWAKNEEGRYEMREVEGSEKVLPCDLALLSMGYQGPAQGLYDMEYDARGNFLAQWGDFSTSVEKVFAAGDCRRGQSTVVWAISEGRQCAREVDRYLMGSTQLP
uniref:glutamate synthase (NADH) n=1 Tax=Norrisiella sphaerica TaxID=552664 RepID=A0A7S2QRY5_9EUKA|mmetsp:Transcript_1475/g.2020  ORF Transcript_1475/g.2020 Transcript_1475/m.2020 type:complete len:2153 (+) Transcript_1475:147-6605(+)|eukprot:CAMPEP_0184502178 /NCGR_PEP_ID=MMETSP0113_2-20130426/49555_1 /TAXON_ID=91329 /ORGANISM="Norrisiella sphaerica, Strain BC52" /LENGTH=2152 /DNA_ID=CAMNT_0026891215 /DNA_START=139 /DNA_END=6597 /DNA_ORIENTATION=-